MSRPSSPSTETTPLLSQPVNLSTAGATLPQPSKPSPHNPILLSSQQNGSQAQPPADADGEEDRIPFKQVFWLCFARIADPMTFFCIVPFINQMVFETGVEEEDVGFYSGLIESLFSLTQMLTMLIWGRISDRVGRKPVLISTLFGLSITATLFGFSRHIWQMILFRCLAGLCSGTVVTIRTILSESSTPRTQARIFSFFAVASNIGIFLGPVIGALARPTRQFDLFKGVRFWEENPYALPTLLTGAFAFVAAVVCTVAVDETLDLDQRSKRDGKRAVRSDESNDENASERDESPHRPMSMWELISSPGVPNVLFVWGIVSMLGFAFTAIFPLHCFTSIPSGGFGLPPPRIALFFTFFGVAQVIWLLLVFPPLQHRIGTGSVLRVCAGVLPITWIVYPIMTEILKAGAWGVFWAVALVNGVVTSGTSMMFTAVQLAVNDIAPTHRVLGTLNGVALSLQSGIRAVAPGVFTAIYAVGVKYQILNGYLIWVLLLSSAFVFAVSLRWFPKKAEGLLKNQREDEEQN